MKTTCKRYFVDPSQLTQGAAVEALEKHGEQELTHEYEALLSPNETAAKKNKQEARKWMEAICNAHKQTENNG